MKKYFSLFFIILSFNCYSKIYSVNSENLIDKNGIFYVKNMKEPFSGMAIFEKNREFYKDGHPNGKWLTFYKNGRLKSIENWKNGVLNGNYVLYRENGNRISKTTFTDGKDNGNFQLYHTNGKIQIEGFFHMGTPIGIWKYYNDTGKLIGKVDYTKNNVFFDQKN
ncbi:toxin-antitoxin system YwqK family antitoxin [Cetobacterium sp. SF1]|uniref:toxin-antitoxin system YwqK family antitoxin n=1 Tax=unclassified Cetobacterium TaxID=2630983 RepID=UPI003CF49371